MKLQDIKIYKFMWPEYENEVLKQIVQNFGDKDWTLITREFNKVAIGSIRTRKQCRDHWLNYLNPEVNRYW